MYVRLSGNERDGTVHRRKKAQSTLHVCVHHQVFCLIVDVVASLRTNDYVRSHFLTTFF